MSRREETAAIFESAGIGPAYDEICDGDYTTAKYLADQLHYTGVSQPQNIVALAVGTGLCTAEVKKLFPKARITGVDLSSEMIDQAKSKSAADQFIQADITKPVPGIEKDSVDMVMCVGGSEFIDDIDTLTAEMARVAKPGATLVLSYRPDDEGPIGREFHHHYSDEEIEVSLAKHGAKIISRDRHTTYTTHDYDSERHGNVDNKFIKGGRGAEDTTVRSQYTTIVATMPPPEA